MILSDPKNRPIHKFIIQNGRTETSKQDFLLFKQYYCLSWGSIVSLLRRVEKLLTDYSVPIAIINGDRYSPPPSSSLLFDVLINVFFSQETRSREDIKLQKLSVVNLETCYINIINSKTSFH